MTLAKSNLYRWAGLLLLFFLQSALQVAFADKAQFLPNFLLLFIVIFTLAHSLPMSIWQAFAAGFLLEIFSGWFFGAYIFAMLSCALLVYLVTRKLTAREISPATGLLLVFVVTVAMAAVLYLYSELFAALGAGPAVSPHQFISWRLLWAVVINLAAFYPLLMLSRVLGRLLLPADEDARPF